METIRRKKRSIIIAFILSLLFHASFVIYLLWQRTDPSNTALPEEELQRTVKKEEDQWAETKARAGNFGAPVFFKDEPAFAEAMADRPEPDTEDKPEETQQEQSEQPETKAPELERSIDIPDPEEISTPLPQQKDTTTTQPPRRTRAPREKKEEPVQRQPQKTAPQPAQRQPSPPNSKQLPTLAQLTQGFLHQTKDEGTHTIHMLGKKSGRPTDEQMKYERYLQKLSWCLQNSFQINNNRFPSDHMETEAHIFLALDKDGRIKQLSLAKSSGSKLLDQFVLFIFRDASSSFPPVPHYLPRDPFTIMYTITLNPSDNNFRVYRR